MICCVLISAVQMALDVPLLDPNSNLKKVLDGIDYVTMSIFSFECLAKIIAYGLIFNGQHSFLKQVWSLLDFIILIVSYLCQTPLVSHFKVVKTFKIFKSLRLIGRNEGL